MNITIFSPHLRQMLEDMLAEYFLDDLQSDIPEDILRGKLMDHIVSLAGQGLIRIAIGFQQDIPICFSIYQIDCPESDWCKRPGWGFIREFYVRREYRGQGFGSALAAHTELALRDMGAVHLYLTSDEAVEFWQGRGWHPTGEICSNGLEILTK